MSQVINFNTGGGGGGTNIQTITGTSGGPVGPDAGHNFNLIGVSPINTPGNPGTNTINVTVDVASQTQTGVIQIATNAEVITGTNSDDAVVPSGLTAKLGAQTLDGVAYGAGTTQSTQWTAAGTDGQLVIAATGSAPAFATLTSSDSSISFTTGANTLSLQVTSGTTVGKTITGDSGGALSPTAGNWNIVGTSAQGITSSGSGSTLTFTNANATTSQNGVLTLATNAEAIAGTDTTKAITSDDLKAKLGTQTNHGVLVGASTTSALTALAVGTNGQVLLGSTGADPAFATLTSTGGTIVYTLGAHALNLDTSGTTTLTYTNVNTTPYVVLSTDQYLSVDSSGGAITLRLPNAAALGRTYVIKDRTGSSATNNITITTVGGAVNIDAATSFVMNTAYEAIQIMGNSSTYEVF